MIIFEVVLTVAVVVFVVGGVAAAVTRPVWTALWKRYQLEKALEDRERALTAAQQRERAAALQELDAVLHTADGEPETGVPAPLLPDTGAPSRLPAAGTEKDRLQKVGLCDQEE